MAPRKKTEAAVKGQETAAALTVQEKEEKAVEKKEPPKPRPKKLKFSFKEQREYDTIDADIAALEEKNAACDREIAENASDYLALERLSEEKSQLEAQLDEKTERWVYLTELAEQIEAQRQEGNR